MTKGRQVMAALLAGLLAAAALAEGPKKEEKKEGKTDPPGAPVEAVLKVNKEAYTLDLGGLSAEDFRKGLKAGDETGAYPEAPKVDLTLELRNTGKEEIKLQYRGTQNVLTLELTGPGAVTVPLKRRITPKFLIAPMTVSLEPGKSVTVPVTSLEFGFKGGTRAYWTEPGKYTLSASYKTAVSPAPKGAREGPDGFGAVTVTSAPVTLRVEPK